MAAFHVVNMAVAAVPVAGVSLTAIGGVLGVKPQHLSAGLLRWRDYAIIGPVLNRHRLNIIVLRGKERSDKCPDEWLTWVGDVGWLHPEVTRAAESTWDTVRNPLDKSDEHQYRIHWLETKLSVVVDQINVLGRVRFPDDYGYPDHIRRTFIVSYKDVIAVKHFCVRRPRRDVCLCRYHESWSLMCGVLFSARVCAKKDTACPCPNWRDPYEVRRALVCTPEGPSPPGQLRSSLLEPRECVNSVCVFCPRFDGRPAVEAREAGPGRPARTARLAVPGYICADDLDVLLQPHKSSSWQAWVPVQYTRKDGTVKSGHDFRLVEKPTSQLLEALRSELPSFLLHHDLMRWQGRDLAFKREHFPRGCISSTQDFSENGSLEPRREIQSRYYNEISYTLFGICCQLHLADLRDTVFDGIAGLPGQEAKALMIEMFDDERLPAVVTLTFVIISPDLHHDVAMVQKK